MKKQTPEFLRKADNVYRTRDYIVVQRISIVYDGMEDPETVSRDVYYRRTRKRDADYEALGRKRRNLDGKRLPATMHTRKYID